MPTSGQILRREEAWYSGSSPPPLILIKIYVNHNSFYDNLTSQISDREKIVFIDFI